MLTSCTSVEISHSRRRLADSSDEMSPCVSRLRTSSVTDRRLILSRVTNRAVRPERCWRLLSYVYFCGDVDNKNGRTYQKAKFVDKKLSSQYNRFSCFLLQVPQTFSSLRPQNYVVYTTVMRRYKIRPFFTSNLSQLSSVMSSISDDPLTQFTAKPSFAMQAIAWG